MAAATKHIVNAMAVTPGSGSGVLMLVDMQGYYPGISLNSATAQTLVGTPTLRYTNGVGVRACLITTVAAGATAHNIAYSYTNSAGASGKTNPVTGRHGIGDCLAPHALWHGGQQLRAVPAAGVWRLRHSVGAVGHAVCSFWRGHCSAGAGAANRHHADYHCGRGGGARFCQPVSEFAAHHRWRMPDGGCISLAAPPASNTNFYGSIEAAWS